VGGEDTEEEGEDQISTLTYHRRGYKNLKDQVEASGGRKDTRANHRRSCRSQKDHSRSFRR
jgi:hypothetical protein